MGGVPQLAQRAHELRRTKAFSPVVEVLRKIQCGRCFFCLGRISTKSYLPGQREHGYTRDHVVPRAAGGGTLRNIVLACRACNEAKADRMPTALELAAVRQIWAAVLIAKPDMLPTFSRSDVLH